MGVGISARLAVLATVAISGLALVAIYLIGDQSATSQPASALTEISPRDTTGALPVSPAGSEWAWIAILVLALAFLGSTAITFYLYRWRRILMSSPHLVVPEELGVWTGKLNDGIRLLSAEVRDFGIPLGSCTQEFRRTSEATRSEINALSQTFLAMQRAIDSRDAELDRFKRGYDSEIFRRFVGRFIRVDQALEDLQQSGSIDPKGLEDVRRLLEDAFAECGIEPFSPTLGEDYRTAFGVASAPKLVRTHQAEKGHTICKVDQPGYMLRGTTDVIIPARVSVFVSDNGAP